MMMMMRAGAACNFSHSPTCTVRPAAHATPPSSDVRAEPVPHRWGGPRSGHGSRESGPPLRRPPRPSRRSAGRLARAARRQPLASDMDG
eukprot:scaffold1057_cov459-Prasinococcus_capsulatus_cf.AAC.4